MKIDGERKEHESYGLISLSRISGRGEPLFGSSIRHSEVLRLRISRGVMNRDLSRDWYHERDDIVEVDMSNSQFAEFVTTHNRGCGIPCTIRYVNGERVEDPPFDDKREQFRQEFKEHAATVARRLDELHAFAESLREKPTVTKTERAELVERIRMARQEVASNMPFMATQFDVQMDKSIKEAKGEIEAFALRRVVTAGIAAIEKEEREAAQNGLPAIEPPRPSILEEGRS